MYTLVILVHIIACSLLILIVLIQQGRGGGLIDNLSSAESIFGTKTNTFLVKSTSVLAVVFFFTCLGLAFLSIQKSKSLIETNYKPPAASTAVPVPSATTVPVTPTTPSVPVSPKAPAAAVPATTAPVGVIPVASVPSPAPIPNAPAQTSAK